MSHYYTYNTGTNHTTNTVIIDIRVPPSHPGLIEPNKNWRVLLPFANHAKSVSRGTIRFSMSREQHTIENINRIMAAITDDRDVTTHANVYNLFKSMCDAHSHPLDTHTFYLAREYVSILTGTKCDEYNETISVSDRALAAARAHMTAISFGAEIDPTRFQMAPTSTPVASHHYQYHLHTTKDCVRMSVTVPPLHPCLTATEASTWMIPSIQNVSAVTSGTINFSLDSQCDIEDTTKRIMAIITDNRDIPVRDNVYMRFACMCNAHSTPLDVKQFYLAREYVALITDTKCNDYCSVDTSDRVRAEARAHMSAIHFGAKIVVTKFQIGTQDGEDASARVPSSQLHEGSIGSIE